MPVPLYFDHNIDYELVPFLRARGYDVLTAAEDAATRVSDDAILRRASDLGRVVFTHNRRDFQRLHRGWTARLQPHAGILTASMRRQDLIPSRILAFLERETSQSVANRLIALHEYDRYLSAR